MDGAISWVDLTVPDAEGLRNFYEAVAGWTAEPVDMGGYSDYSMSPPGRSPVAGVCHRRGPNADLPPVWLIYITVPDLDASMRRCRELGGEILREPAGAGPQGRFCVIQDPAGAVCALYEKART